MYTNYPKSVLFHSPVQTGYKEIDCESKTVNVLSNGSVNNCYVSTIEAAKQNKKVSTENTNNSLENCIFNNLFSSFIITEPVITHDLGGQIKCLTQRILRKTFLC